MHFNTLTLALCVLSASDLTVARPTASILALSVGSVSKSVHPVSLSRRGGAREIAQQADLVSCVTPPAQDNKGEAAAGGGEEGAENEVDIASKFDTAVPVQGGDLKQDLQFTPSSFGQFEYEFQSAKADEVTVSENKTPAAPPAGFEALEANSYIVSLAQSKGVGLTLSKIDYIFDPASAGLVGKDITAAQVGKLCADTGAFVISETLGELEFELEENEVTLNLNKNVTAEGEWGIFLPVAAAAGGKGAAKEGAAKGGAAKEGAAKGGAAAKEGAAAKKAAPKPASMGDAKAE